jgi:hypothetical protein
MPPKKKKEKKIKIRGGRGARASRPPTKKPNVKQVVNVFTTRAEPYRTDFREQVGFAQMMQPVREQTPFQPVFNYIQPPVQQAVEQPKKVEAEAKPKREYKKKPVAFGVALAEPTLSRQSSLGGYEGGYESAFMPSESDMFRQPTRAEEREIFAERKIQRMEQEMQDQMRNMPGSFEFLGGGMSPTMSAGEMPKPKGRGGRKPGSKNKPKPEATAEMSGGGASMQLQPVSDVPQFIEDV